MPAATSCRVLAAAAAQFVADVAEPLDELGGLAAGVARHVLPHEHLGVAFAAGADADGRDGELAGDLTGELGGHHLHHDGEGAGFLNRDRVGDELLGAVAAALDAEAAEPVDATAG